MITKMMSWIKENPFRSAVILWIIFMVAVLSGITYVWPEPEIIYETVYKPVYIYQTEKCEHPEPAYKNITMTDDEYHLLAALVKEEAGGESFTGQRAVVEVVFNRILDPRFPDTVTEVIMQKNQFSVAHKLHKSNPTQEQYDAIDATLRCVEPVMTKDVLFFASITMKRPLYETIGGHNFYYAKE